MGTLVSSAAALLLSSLLALLSGSSSVLGDDLKETDALCNANGCFVVYFQRKTFLDAWRSCKAKNGNLATVKRKEDAESIATLFSTLDLRHSRTDVRVWIGLQRLPRQCTAARPLRGFSWTTGDQDTEYTNWQREDSPSMCSVSRCVVVGYSTHELNDNLKWLDGSCSVSVDGYLCHYAYKAMCPPLWSEGAGNALYTTPFDLLSTILTHVPFGSVAVLPCPADNGENQSVLCMVKDDGSVGWSRDYPLCAEAPVMPNQCDQDKGGCEHFCRLSGGHVHCSCADGYKLRDDRQTCELSDACQQAKCEFECLLLSDGQHRCACPVGYMLAPDKHSCLDVDECLQSPCEHICVNMPGTFECQCVTGYHPDDEGGCEDIDECMTEPCEHACENTLGSHICHCHLGFSPMPEDPSKCHDIDECQIPETCEQMCANYEGGFECYCREGYVLRSEYSCHKIGEGDGYSAVTPPFPWITPQPGHMWDPADYGWNLQQSNTDWPPEDDQSLDQSLGQPLDWLTDPPRPFESDIIWVTSAPQDDLPFDLAQGSLSQESEEDEGRGAFLLEWGQRSPAEPEVLPTTTPYTTPSPTTLDSSTTPDWYEDEKEETTTAPPFLSTSTISEGAWNWWAELTTSIQNPGNTDDSIKGHNTESSYHNKAEEQYPPRENPQFPEQDFVVEENVEITHSHDTALPTQPSPSQPPTGEGGKSTVTLDPVQEERGEKNSNIWLLVGLLVPTCIFVVVMVALGIVYCTHCAVQPRNKNASDCYHWISGAHDKQGAPNPSTGVKTHV